MAFYPRETDWEKPQVPTSALIENDNAAQFSKSVGRSATSAIPIAMWPDHSPTAQTNTVSATTHAATARSDRDAITVRATSWQKKSALTAGLLAFPNIVLPVDIRHNMVWVDHNFFNFSFIVDRQSVIVPLEPGFNGDLETVNLVI